MVFVASSLGVIGKEFVSNISAKPEATLEEHRNTFIQNCKTASGEEELCTCIFDQAIDKYGFDKYRESNHLLLSKGENAVDPSYLKTVTKELPDLCKQKLTIEMPQNLTTSDNLTNTAAQGKIFNFDDYLSTDEERCQIKSDNIDILAENERYAEVVNEMVADGLKLSNDQIRQLFEDNEKNYREQEYKKCLSS